MQTNLAPPIPRQQTGFRVAADAGIARTRKALGKLGLTGAGALLVFGSIVVAVLAGPLLWTVDPDKTDLANRFAGFSAQNPLGTDEFGRDLLSRLLHGGRMSLSGAFLVLLGTSGTGLAVGLLAGLIGGRIDAVLSRVMDGLLALPTLIVALAIVGALGKSFSNVLFALILTGWPWYGRIYRGLVLHERHQPYVVAATSLGASSFRIMWRHILPNIIGPVLVLATINLGAAILNLTALSFLGLGVQPPQSEWGAMVNNGRLHFQSHPWVIVAPGLTIAATVLAANILGDTLRDLADPHRLRF